MGSATLFSACGAQGDPVRPVDAGLAGRAGGADRDRPGRTRLCRASDCRARPYVGYDDDASGWFRYVTGGDYQGIPPGACRSMAGVELVAADPTGEAPGANAPRRRPLARRTRIARAMPFRDRPRGLYARVAPPSRKPPRHRPF